MSKGYLARKFAQWVTDFNSLDIPSSVVRCGRRSIVDTLGVMVAGGKHEKVVALGRVFSKSVGPCDVIGGNSTNALAAATVNGMAAHVWDFDDNSYTAILHGSTIIFPSVLAVTQAEQLDSDDMLKAFILGSEIAYTLGEICGHSHFLSGWWSTGSCGIIGAVAGVCWLYGMDEDAITSAIGMAAVTSPIARAIAGTDTKPYLAGNVAARAISIATAARAGLTGPEDAFEQENGFFNLLNDGNSQMSVLDQLEYRWRLENPGIFFKTSPVCSAAHAGIDLVARLVKENNIKPETIESIKAYVPKTVFNSLVYEIPCNIQQAQFSLPYCLACAILHGRVRLDDLSPAELDSPMKKRLMLLVETYFSAELSTEEISVKFPECIRIELMLEDGKKIQGFCGEPYGMPNSALTDAALTKKFNECLEFSKINKKFPQPLMGNLLRLATELLKPI